MKLSTVSVVYNNKSFIISTHFSCGIYSWFCSNAAYTTHWKNCLRMDSEEYILIDNIISQFKQQIDDNRLS